MDRNIDLDDFTKICRLCLACGNLQPIGNLKVLDTLARITSIQVTNEDKLPENVCKSCVRQLDRISKFIQTCSDNDKFLRDIINRSAEKECFKETQSTDNDVKSESSDDEKNAYTRDDQIFRNIKEEDEEVDQNPATVNLNQDGPVSCNVCRQIFSTRFGLLDHYKENPNCRPEDAQNIVKYLDKGESDCKNEDDADYDGKEQHLKGKKMFLCNFCGKNYTRKNGLDRHILSHTGVKPFECKECGKRYITKDTLKTHILTHTGIKAFKCQLCGKNFTQSSHLSYHMKRHQGERPFVCTYCGKCFVSNYHLERHKLMHTGVKPYQCKQCGKQIQYTEDGLGQCSNIEPDIEPTTDIDFEDSSQESNEESSDKQPDHQSNDLEVSANKSFEFSFEEEEPATLPYKINCNFCECRDFESSEDQLDLSEVKIKADINDQICGIDWERVREPTFEQELTCENELDASQIKNKGEISNQICGIDLNGTRRPTFEHELKCEGQLDDSEVKTKADISNQTCGIDLDGTRRPTFEHDLNCEDQLDVSEVKINADVSDQTCGIDLDGAGRPTFEHALKCEDQLDVSEIKINADVSDQTCGIDLDRTGRPTFEHALKCEDQLDVSEIKINADISDQTCGIDWERTRRPKFEQELKCEDKVIDSLIYGEQSRKVVDCTNELKLSEIEMVSNEAQNIVQLSNYDFTQSSSGTCSKASSQEKQGDEITEMLGHERDGQATKEEEEEVSDDDHEMDAFSYQPEVDVGHSNRDVGQRNFSDENEVLPVVLRTIFQKMPPDSVSTVAMSDPLICDFALECVESGNTEITAMKKMRELAKLLIRVKILEPSIDSLKDALKPGHVSIIICALKILGKFDDKLDKYEKGASVLSVGISLKHCCKICVKKADSEDKKKFIGMLIILHKRLPRSITTNNGEEKEIRIEKESPCVDRGIKTKSELDAVRYTQTTDNGDTNLSGNKCVVGGNELTILHEIKEEEEVFNIFEKIVSGSHDMVADDVTTLLGDQMSIGYTKGKIHRERATFCFICKKNVLHFVRHLRRHHPQEHEAKEILSLPSGDKHRKVLITTLRKKWNFFGNRANPRPARKLTNPVDKRVLPCSNCLGFYAAKYLYRHKRTCGGDSGGRRHQVRGQNLLLEHDVDPLLFETIFQRMTPDDVSFVAKNDPLVCDFALKKLKTKKNMEVAVLSARMRELAKLIIHTQTFDQSVKGLRDLLKPKYYDIIISSLKILAKFNEKVGKYQLYHLVQCIGSSLRSCCDIVIADESSEDAQEVRDMLDILRLQWPNSSVQADEKTDKTPSDALTYEKRQNIPIENAKRKIIRWTEEQKKVVKSFFAEHIKKKKIVNLSDCKKIKNAYPTLLANKDWTKIKSFVQYQCKKTSPEETKEVSGEEKKLLKRTHMILGALRPTKAKVEVKRIYENVPEGTDIQKKEILLSGQKIVDMDHLVPAKLYIYVNKEEREKVNDCSGITFGEDIGNTLFVKNKSRERNEMLSDNENMPKITNIFYGEEQKLYEETDESKENFEVTNIAAQHFERKHSQTTELTEMSAPLESERKLSKVSEKCSEEQAKTTNDSQANNSCAKLYIYVNKEDREKVDNCLGITFSENIGDTLFDKNKSREKNEMLSDNENIPKITNIFYREEQKLYERTNESKENFEVTNITAQHFERKHSQTTELTEMAAPLESEHKLSKVSEKCPKGQAQTTNDSQANNSRPGSYSATQLIDAVLRKMPSDEITWIAQNDTLIRSFALDYLKTHKLGNISILSRKMRELAELLLLSAKSDSSLVYLIDILKPINLYIIINTLKTMGQYDDNLNTLGNSLTVSSVKESLVECCEIVIKERKLTPHAIYDCMVLIDILKTQWPKFAPLNDTTQVDTDELLSLLEKKSLVPWTNEQKKVIKTYFARHIKHRTEVGELECSDIKKLYPDLLANKKWQNIRQFVQNTYRRMPESGDLINKESAASSGICKDGTSNAHDTIGVSSEEADNLTIESAKADVDTVKDLASEKDVVLDNCKPDDCKAEDDSVLDETEEDSDIERPTKRFKHFCIICKLEVANFARHVQRHHSHEPVLRHILQLPQGSRKRKTLFTKLRKTWNSLSGTIRPQPKLPCTNCLGYYTAHRLLTHRKKCRGVTSDRKHQELNLLEANFVDPLLVETIFSKMQTDYFSLVARSDPMICTVALDYLKLNKSKPSNVSIKMRELAKLLILLKHLEPTVSNLRDILKPAHFDAVFRAIKTLGKYDDALDRFQKGGLVVSVGASLKNCCRIITLKEDSSPEEVRACNDFWNLLKRNWPTYVPATKEVKLRKSHNIVVRTRWTEQQKEAVTVYFSEQVKPKKSVTEADCIKLKNMYPDLLANKDWTKIKAFVQYRFRTIPEMEKSSRRESRSDTNDTETFFPRDGGVQEDLPLAKEESKEMNEKSTAESDIKSRLEEVNSRVDALISDASSMTEVSPAGEHIDDPTKVVSCFNKKKRRILIPWTSEQKQVVKAFFADHIKRKQAVKQYECSNLKTQYPELLANKSWEKIKVYVQNLYTNKAK
ncbi:unnamed protein product [Callosobruchus maculatus]|uniref:ZAD domain-containing protein n=1 Tax=Callosobruchus maculatus TaxID=64391 RepID=A0A653BSX1_CALMS|nr:unnamed protein product [Callosobruchus maculatus]